MSIEVLEADIDSDVAPLCKKTIDETSKLLWDLAVAGFCFINIIHGVDKYWLDTWIPGIMKMMVKIGREKGMRRFSGLSRLKRKNI